ncbi:Hypothetical protein AA314_08859 [Archangium gephyra]|uniref:Uncharacterized protein n=1 Tax=Archangium gephyra TaxID=48 RepID=A0AAC8QGC0_9BACT|nr:Hypothetical protein AA314_08859 [Archangium gephyra]
MRPLSDFLHMSMQASDSSSQSRVQAARTMGPSTVVLLAR